MMPAPILRSRNIISHAGPRIGICLLLTALTLAVYWQAGHFGFIGFDDPLYVTENPHVKAGLSSSSIAWSFSFEDKERLYWQPLTWLSHMVDVEMFGLHPGSHHLINVALHLVNVLLLFVGLSRLTGSIGPSAVVAALFAVHPINVESVAWVAARKNLLSTIFWMLTTWAYVHYAEKPGMARYLALTLIFLLGLLSKPMLVTLPCALLLLDFWPLRRLRFASEKFRLEEQDTCGRSLPGVQRRWELVMEKIPLLVLSVLVSWLAADSMKYSGTVMSFEVIPLGLRIQNALVSVFTYIGKLIWPAHLAMFYPYPEVVSPWQTGISVLVLIGMTTYACLGMRKRPYLIVGWLWFLGTLAPVSGIMQVGLWPALADRWAYVPSIGFFAIIVWGGYACLQRWGRQAAKGVAAAAASVLIISMAIVSHRQAMVWDNSISLFAHAIAHTEGNFVAHNNLGAELHRAKQSEQAVFHFHEAIRLNPNYFLAHTNIGIDYLYHGKWEDAETWFAKALAINPRFAEAHHKMAVAKVKLGKVKEALEHYGLALEIDPQDKTVHNDIGCLLVEVGQPEKAVHFFNNTLRLDPDDADANYNIAVAYSYLGQTEDSARHFEKARAIKPEYAQQEQKLKEALVSKAR